MVEYVADAAGYRATVKTNEPGTANANPADVQVSSLTLQPSDWYLVFVGQIESSEPPANVQQAIAAYSAGPKAAIQAPRPARRS